MADEHELSIELRQIEGLAFAARAGSNHWVAMDGPADFQGFGAGTRPMEMLLMSLAGCTGMDVVSILHKMRAPLTDFRMQTRGVRATEHPKVFTEIEIVYHFYGDVPVKQVERAIELSQDRYCSISAMLKPTVKLTHRYEIHRPTESPPPETA